MARHSADITLAAGEEFSGDISILTPTAGTFSVFARTARGLEDQAQVTFKAPRPAKILFRDDPAKIDSRELRVPFSVYLADDGGLETASDRDLTIRFSPAQNEEISFDSEAIVLRTGETSASAVFQLRELPYGSEIKLLATSDQGIRAGLKGIQITSRIEKLRVSGPRSVNRGGEAEFTVSRRQTVTIAPLTRIVRLLSISLTTGCRQLNSLFREEQQQTVRLRTPNRTGDYAVTATSKGIKEGAQVLTLSDPPVVLIALSLLGALIGGLAKQLHKDASLHGFSRSGPVRHELGLVGRLFGSLVGGIFFTSH